MSDDERQQPTIKWNEDGDEMLVRDPYHGPPKKKEKAKFKIVWIVDLVFILCFIMIFFVLYLKSMECANKDLLK